MFRSASELPLLVIVRQSDKPFSLLNFSKKLMLLLLVSALLVNYSRCVSKEGKRS